VRSSVDDAKPRHEPAQPHVKIKAKGLAGLDSLGAVVTLEKRVAHGLVHSAPLVRIESEKLVQKIEHLVTGEGGTRVNGTGRLSCQPPA
jgi:hypothetical protein